MATCWPIHRLELILLLFLVNLIVACGSSPFMPRNNTIQTLPSSASSTVTTQYDIRSLLVAAESADPFRANHYRVVAAELALAAGNQSQAVAILALVTHELELDDARSLALLREGLAIQARDADLALRSLKRPEFNTVTMQLADRIKFGEMKAHAYYISRNHLASARERVFFDHLLTPELRAKNHEQIFLTLLEISSKTLTAQAKKAITNDLRGWLSLAALAKQYQNDPQAQLQALKQWQQLWVTHPAASQLPVALSSLPEMVASHPQSLALLLPLQGQLGIYGRAIRDAIVAARYQLGNQVTIKVYDTSSSGDIADLVNQAAKQGAELIIGPLSRSYVTDLSKLNRLPVPILALNRSFNGSSHPDLYQFGLAPEDEIVQVADQVFQEGMRNAFIIYPEGDWGERNAETFRNRWQKLGGSMIDEAYYRQQQDYSDMVKSLLDIDQSEQRAANLLRIIGERFEFRPRRRQDIDFIFLLGNQTQARGINPILAFYYAENVPVYSTSHVHEYSESRIESIDLNGIQFCDMPWKLTDQETIQQEIQVLWPEAKATLAPFYALGLDAFRLYPRLQQMQDLSIKKIFGATGVLTLNQDNVVIRVLPWARFTNGQVVPLSTTVESL